MKHKQNSELNMQRCTKQRHQQHSRSLKKQKRAAHKEDRVVARTYLQAVEKYGIWTEVDYV